MAATMLKTNAYHNGAVAPNTMATATPPNDTWANPSPINARFRISKNEPSALATIVIRKAAINERWKSSIVKKCGK